MRAISTGGGAGVAAWAATAEHGHRAPEASVTCWSAPEARLQQQDVVFAHDIAHAFGAAGTKGARKERNARMANARLTGR
jgi:hypothetical protein